MGFRELTDEWFELFFDGKKMSNTARMKQKKLIIISYCAQYASFLFHSWSGAAESDDSARLRVRRLQPKRCAMYVLRHVPHSPAAERCCNLGVSAP